jgi:hypothetical protein
MQKYVGTVVAICRSGSDTNFWCDPQFGEFRNIPFIRYNVTYSNIKPDTFGIQT